MSIESLLPDNRTALELALEQTLREAIAAKGSVFPLLWRPAEIPAPLLPWLGEAMGVSEWDASAPEAEQRATLANFWPSQRLAGTGVAIKKAIEPLGLGATAVAGYEIGGSAYSLHVELEQTTSTLDPALLDRVAKRIEAAKSERDTYQIDVVITSQSPAYIGAAFIDQVVAESLPFPAVIESRP